MVPLYLLVFRSILTSFTYLLHLPGFIPASSWINCREKPGRLLDSYTASKMQGENRFGEERAKAKVDEN